MIAEVSPLIQYGVPSIAAAAASIVAAMVNRSSKNRETKANEVITAYQNRGILVDSLKERIDEGEKREEARDKEIAALRAKIDEGEAREAECQRRLGELEEQVRQLERRRTRRPDPT